MLAPPARLDASSSQHTAEWTRRPVGCRRLRQAVNAPTESASRLIEHLCDAGVTTAPGIQRAHVEEYLAGVAARWRLATVRYRALQQFFGWLFDEEEIGRNPMARMKPPTVPENPVPVLTLEELRRLVASCEGRSFADRRDNAIIRLFAEMRVSELAGVAVSDLDRDLDVAVVTGKGCSASSSWKSITAPWRV
jgi:site-specific recombinase XerD